jgi:hypothetical protein
MGKWGDSWGYFGAGHIGQRSLRIFISEEFGGRSLIFGLPGVSIIFLGTWETYEKNAPFLRLLYRLIA